jgi:hypothetical protein
MNPLDVDSAADVRDGWSDWDYGERLDALAALANANLDKYGYDEVDVYNVPGDAAATTPTAKSISTTAY